MRPRSWLILALTLAGCNYSPARFAKKVSWTWCDWRHRCDDIDAGQAEICWETEWATWDDLLAADKCDFAKDRSKRLYKVWVEDTEAADCDLGEGYTVLSILAEDICQQPHSAVDTQDEEDTGPDSGA